MWVAQPLFSKLIITWPDILPILVHALLTRYILRQTSHASPLRPYIQSHLACFLGALHLCASKAGKPHATENALVHVNAYLGHPIPPPIEGGRPETVPGAAAGFGLKVDIHVEGVEDDGIIQAAHYVSALPLCY